jgi:subtilisin family serine protease
VSGGGYKTTPKVIYYESYADSQDDAMGHGTHVAASVAGKSHVPGYMRYNGVAPDAQIAFIDIGQSSTGGLYVPGDLYAMFQRMYEAGARVITNSWGAASYVTGANRYSFDARNVDLFMYNYPDALVLFAAGNQGSNGAGSVVTPSTNKNGVCVGASINNDQSWISLTGRSLHGTDGRAVAYFSSYGPTEDLRLKPDIIAPGHPIFSVNFVLKYMCMYVHLRRYQLYYIRCYK